MHPSFLLSRICRAADWGRSRQKGCGIRQKRAPQAVRCGALLYAEIIRLFVACIVVSFFVDAGP